MKRPRLLTLAAGCLGFALDVGALVLEGLGLVIFAARQTPRMGSCSTCGKRRDVYMLRADGVCRYCAAPVAMPVEASRIGPAPTGPKPACAACGIRPAMICDLCATCEERQHLAGGTFDGPSLERLRTTPPAPACVDPDCHVGAPHTTDHPKHVMHATAKELPAR